MIPFSIQLFLLISKYASNCGFLLVYNKHILFIFIASYIVLNIFLVIECRLGSDENTGQSTSGLFICAVCQVDLAPSEGISVHAGSIFSTSSKPWQGPFLCAGCRDKKDAMEGKRPSGIKVS